MNDEAELRTRAKLTAQRYFEGFEDSPTPELIGELETLAYKIAREGDNREATRIFVLISELSLNATEHGRSPDYTEFSTTTLHQRSGKSYE